MEGTRTLDLANRPKPAARVRAGRVPNLGLAVGTSKRGRHTCSIDVPGNEPPTEFRIFTAGEVVTTKGTFVFDAAAADSVMADYTAHGIDLMIDYDHASLASVTLDPAESGKAAGWFNLEVRNGELWAVNVRWTPSATEALRAKEWRFMSPAFSTDDKGHVTSLLNVAITNLPATRNLDPLVAAGRARDLRALSTGPAFADVQMAICAALDAQYPSNDQTPYEERPWITDVFDASVVYQFKGAFYEAPYTFDGSAATLGAPVEVKRTYAPIQAPAAPAAANRIKKLATGGMMLDPKQITEALDALVAGDEAKCMELLKGIIATAAGGEAPPADKPADAPPMGASEKPEEVAAAVSKMMRLSGVQSYVALAEKYEAAHAAELKLETETQKLAEERKVLESAERRKLCVELVSLAGRAPATVWADDKCSALKTYLATMPIADLRAMHADEIKAKGGRSAAIVPPAGDSASAGGGKDITVADGRVVSLSAREIAMCTEMKIDPKDYAARKPAKKD